MYCVQARFDAVDRPNPEMYAILFYGMHVSIVTEREVCAARREFVFAEAAAESMRRT